MAGKKYEELATRYAEQYGIIVYKVKGKYMIYNQNYYNSEYLGKWVRKPCTMQRTVNLDTFEVQSRQLQKLQPNGWHNV